MAGESLLLTKNKLKSRTKEALRVEGFLVSGFFLESRHKLNLHLKW